MVGVEAGPYVKDGCTILIGYGPGFDPIDGTVLPLAVKHATGFSAAAVVDKQFTCAGEGQDGGPGFCGCQVNMGT